ncbi:bifunctional diaminohydroxyphosphoribosylaminopyrimidine deaminase/5-amino-6-(5-phosphoribosylamino)uracil reductase RibD [Pseudopedobacter saltans]|nr:bifunctional diaminohydroxyphosphoribosylaminopyrimidine deaminase/5-amino-6-(5-phosphoribosylamino)uracil reductase RibD [Pseudopedobacter saltans]
MQRAIDLALLGAGSVSPNPMVGAVVAHDGQIIGEGYHKKYGESHAEVNAIQNVIDNFKNADHLLKQSTIYVTLEPCAHYGKTPPCADLIIKHCIPRIVIGCRDPFDSVNGKGIEKLLIAGKEVITGVLETECLELNRRFFTQIQKQRPYVILKWAQTANGFFAPENHQQRWITGKESKILVHQWRAEEDCILVGKNTAIIDNPQLNVRLVKGKNPKRAVIDKNLALPPHLNLLDNKQETFIFNAIESKIVGKNKYISIEDFDHFLPQYILYQLYLQDVQSVIVEGGVTTLQSFIKHNLWDEARIFYSEDYWENGINAPTIKGNQISTDKVGSDTLTILKP